MTNFLKTTLIISTTIITLFAFPSCTQMNEDDIFSQIIEDSNNGKDGKTETTPPNTETDTL